MFGSDDRVEVACPICSISHYYRVRVKQQFLDDNMFSLLNVRKPGERTFRARLYCVRTGEHFDADVRLYETLHRRTEEIRVRDTRKGGSEIVAWAAAGDPASRPARRRRHAGVRLGRRSRRA